MTSTATPTSDPSWRLPPDTSRRGGGRSAPRRRTLLSVTRALRISAKGVRPHTRHDEPVAFDLDRIREVPFGPLDAGGVLLVRDELERRDVLAANARQDVLARHLRPLMQFGKHELFEA